MKNQYNIPLYQALIEHVNKNPISFHVPGHKYGQSSHSNGSDYFHQILQLDATELTGLDDLHSPEGVIFEAESLLADFYQVKESFFLVNGSTIGNLTMIMAVCKENDIVLVQRNCHKSVLNAIKLAKVHPIFLEPEYDLEWKVAAGISGKTVETAISLYPGAKAIILTYPNYYGLVYDLKGIINLAHQHQIPILVDEAHGPHFIIGDPFPQSAVQMGADIVVQSAHKTLPAMTMGSYLHFNSDLLAVNRIKEYLQIFQSSSPSYPIMASLDLARNYLATYHRRDLLYILNEIKQFKNLLSDIPSINVLEFPNHQGDQLKITLQSACDLSGFDLQKRFEKLGIFTELADPHNVLFILPLLKENQPYPLERAASRIKNELYGVEFKAPKKEVHIIDQKISGLAIPYKEMENYKEKEVPISMAIGQVSAETVIPYPPGIPLLLRGEKITKDKLDHLRKLVESGARFQGGASLEKQEIKVFWTA
jgi:arginine/lysine/ornithine decarboxylase